ncbi:hypothetical protein BTS2_0050 [Bacillus sp. TS-2]|nr:hypothetical protein BTS2_0050 [Bacillus sp. TS-2]
MSLEEKVCKGCESSVTVEKKDLIRLLGSIPSDKMSSNTVYEKRVSTCLGCEALLYGTTCKFSGMIVFYKAKQKEKRCPYPQNGKW